MKLLEILKKWRKFPYLENDFIFHPQFDPPPPPEYGKPTIDVPSISREYNGSGFLRIFTLWALEYCSTKPKDCQGGWVPLKFPFHKLAIKYGAGRNIIEAVNLRLVASETSIRVPKVYSAFMHEREPYILMELIDGVSLRDGWSVCTNDEKDYIILQLKGIFEELRNIPHPMPGAIAAGDMQTLFDPRLRHGSYGFGPFANEEDFNNFILCGVHEDSPILTNPETSLDTQTKSEIKEVITRQKMVNHGHKVCFTHGDVNPGNILIKGGKVVALIDFELAGFYPEYWEYVNAIIVMSHDEFWVTEVGQCLTPYPEEFYFEILRRMKHFSRRGLYRVYPWE
ncbi:hypothetical protein LSUE1_G000105 [Lachnellula suecica]|uniref:Aminoglycoside phosphotransferase domain-containing protein n=1 Tax=Lachnellula suecica TaxID=602035 RepID=A0A8T9CI93_9HELO|nr:hypothetical protein LSUE1_G000105 [Lachnellula suecica]